MTCLDARKLYLRCGCLAITLVALAAVGLATARDEPPTGQPAKDASTSPRPKIDHAIVPAFERFQPAGKLDAEHGGQLLLGELNCTSCHKPTAAAAAALQRKQAPILDGVGTRVRPSWIRQFLADPQAVKPGTTMPNLLADLPAAERKAKIESLVHFLASTGSVLDRNPEKNQIPAGKQLFHRIGCVACHGPRGADAAAQAAAALPTTVPLGNLAAKYTVPGLAGFLVDPHKVRPSGRMPSFNLSADEARQLASYLLEDVQVESGDVNPLNYHLLRGAVEHSARLRHAQAESDGQSGRIRLQCCTAIERNGPALLGFSPHRRARRLHVLHKQRRRQQTLDRRQTGGGQRRRSRAGQ